MAKGSLFFSTSRGKVGNLVVSNIRGQEVWRAYQPNVTNPRTNPQTLQRIKFAEAVKFYKHAYTRFFRFAYEDKSKTESDYNAFMRHNISKGCVVTRSQYKNDNYPALGFTYQLSQGSLGDITLGQTYDASGFSYGVLSLPSFTNEQGTMGELSTALAADYGLIYGDVVTLVTITTGLEALDDDPAAAPEWYIVQFFIDTDSTVKISEYRDLQGHFLVDQYDGELLVSFGSEDSACACACIFSRKTASGLKASNSYLVNNTTAAMILEKSKEAAWEQAALTSWNAEGEAVLEGSLAKEEDSSVDVSLGFVSQFRLTSPISCIQSYGLSDTPTGIAVAGAVGESSKFLAYLTVYAPYGVNVVRLNLVDSGSAFDASSARFVVDAQSNGYVRIKCTAPARSAIVHEELITISFLCFGSSDYTNAKECTYKVRFINS